MRGGGQPPPISMIKKIIIIAIAVLLLPLVVKVSEDPDAWKGDVLDVMIIDGQSNAAYGTDIANPTVVASDFPDAPNKKLLYYGTSTKPITYGLPGNPNYDTTFESYGIHEMYSDGWIIGGYEPGLAYILSERSGHDVLIINIAVPGATVAELSPSGECGIYGKAVINHALDGVRDQYDTLNMLGYVWAQGEADYDTTIRQYEADFLAIKNDLAKVGADECYIIKTRAKWGNSVAAQTDLIHQYSDIVLGTNITDTFTVSDGTLMSDNTHYTQKGRDIIANILGDEIDLNEPKHTDVYTIAGVIVVVLIAGILLAAVAMLRYRSD